MAYQFTQTGQEIQDILNQVGDNTADISALGTRMTTAEGDIDAAQDDITALNQGLSQFSNVLSGAAACGLTAQAGVTITKAYKLKIGRLVSYNMQIYVTTSASATNLITGFEPYMGQMNGMSGYVQALNNSSNTDFYVYVSDGGALRLRSLPSNADLRFSLTYITAS